MTAGKKKQKNSEPGIQEVELNVMPFIDIFSLLCTFLLFSAVFVTIGVLEVQVPFLSNAAPDNDTENKRSLSLKIEIEPKALSLSTSFSRAPINQQDLTFTRDEEGIKDLHLKLLELRDENPETDKVTVFVDDTITYEELVQVLDQIKLRYPGDPGFKQNDSDVGIETSLYPKVVMGSVIL